MVLGGRLPGRVGRCQEAFSLKDLTKVQTFVRSFCCAILNIMIQKNLAEIRAELRQLLNDVLGSRMAGLYLYGSYARGEARPDSDIDILVVVRSPFDYGELISLTSRTVADISLKYDVVVSRAFLSENDFEKSQGLFARNIRREIVSI